MRGLILPTLKAGSDGPRLGLLLRVYHNRGGSSRWAHLIRLARRDGLGLAQ
jgi:hypothetical protein